MVIDHSKRALSHTTMVLALLTLFAVSAFSQDATPQSADDAAIRQILLNQPDYRASQNFIFGEPQGGFSATHTVAKIRRRVLVDDGDRILITEPGHFTTRIYPKRREFSRSPAGEVDQTDIAVTPEELAKRGDIRFSVLGSDTIAGEECQKFEAAYNDERFKAMRFLFCAAPRLKNLIVFQQALAGPVTMTTTLTNISLNVSPRLFRIPSGYKRVREKSPDQQFIELTRRIRRASKPSKPRK